MTNQFAKLFEFEDDQLLVMRYPMSLHFRTKADTWRKEFDSPDLLNDYFASFDQKAAEEVYKSMTKKD